MGISGCIGVYRIYGDEKGEQMLITVLIRVHGPGLMINFQYMNNISSYIIVHYSTF